jgi:hypothetical protein
MTTSIKFPIYFSGSLVGEYHLKIRKNDIIFIATILGGVAYKVLKASKKSIAMTPLLEKELFYGVVFNEDTKKAERLLESGMWELRKSSQK